ncbi:methyltransferase domain-containing protein [Thalassospira australica]|uniref:methyltransferase domain-containing protein n=1 Tax=Thalassospira australica TaxID=1528106 RepID=UPI000519F64F|nr:methyltransferase domain-containing protein [Thalassospira australica]
MLEDPAKESSETHRRYANTPETPDFAFDPEDPWTQTFQEGLARADLRGKTVYEVGVGTGINVAFILRNCGAARVYGSDLDPRLVVLAESNLRSLSPQHAAYFEPVHGSVSLIDTDAARAKIDKTDVVIACIPQVGEPSDERLTAFREAQSVKLAKGAEDEAEDHIAHYYPWSLFDEYPYNSVGLGLNEALMRRVRQQAPHAQLVMNFGCRIGTEIICECFEANGYKPEKIASKIVLQHAGTDISFFVTLEKALSGTNLEKQLVCKFYSDPDGKKPLSATEAQNLIDMDPEVALYHEVAVIRGIPITN